MGVTHFDGLDAVSSMAIGGVTLVPTATQLNSLYAYGLQVFDSTFTVAQVNAGTSAIVPAVSGKQFIPTYVAMKATGSAGGATLIRLVEETSSGVVLSHVVADCTDGTWVYSAGGTVVATLLNTVLVANKAILIDKTGSTLTTTTAVRVIVMGAYI